MKKIPLTKGKFALVDDADFIILSQWKWYFGHGYAMRDPKSGRIYMHRFLLKTPKGLETDHINRDKLDNRRSNLRIVSRTQNSINRDMPPNNTSGYKGVTWYKRDRYWQAQIKTKGRNIILYRGRSIRKAVRARKLGELKYHPI